LAKNRYIWRHYVSYVASHYSGCTIVFDGYSSGPTIKDLEHVRRSTSSATTVSIAEHLPVYHSQSAFLMNKENKECLIQMLMVHLQGHGFTVLHPDKKVDATTFRLAVADGLLQCYGRQCSRFARRPTDPPNRLIERHFLTVNPAKTPSGKPVKPDCVVCSNREAKSRHQTTTICEQCRVPLCPYPCMKRHHTMLDYKVECSENYHEPM